jgi:hypothetical protein
MLEQLKDIPKNYRMRKCKGNFKRFTKRENIQNKSKKPKEQLQEKAPLEQAEIDKFNHESVARWKPVGNGNKGQFIITTCLTKAITQI